MAKKVIQSSNAPAAIGPYSQAIAVQATEMVFCSGQIPLDPATGEMAEGIEAQTRRVMENLKAVLTEAGLSFQDVVKTTILLTDLGQFATVNEIYGSYFPAEPPARATFQVSALPRGAMVEIEAIAARTR